MINNRLGNKVQYLYTARLTIWYVYLMKWLRNVCTRQEYLIRWLLKRSADSNVHQLPMISLLITPELNQPENSNIIINKKIIICAV